VFRSDAGVAHRLSFKCAPFIYARQASQAETKLQDDRGRASAACGIGLQATTPLARVGSPQARHCTEDREFYPDIIGKAAEILQEANANAIPPQALTATTTSGAARQATNSTKPTSATPKSPGVFTVVVHTGL
jgi:hypothetical protein